MDERFQLLPTHRRVAHYRAMAAEVRRLSEQVQYEEARVQFLKLATAWDGLADDLECKRGGENREAQNPSADSIAS